MTDKYVIGVDYGTLSGRALLVRVSDGAELASAVFEYPHAVLEESLAIGAAAGKKGGAKLPADWALQVPQDYIDVLANTVPAVLRDSAIDPADVIGISTDFTASTPLPVLADGTPLCELPEFAANPHAYVKLWKHHSAQSHAERINDLAHARGESWINRYGGKISSEWEFAKALQLLEEAPEVYAAMRHWVEAADWITWQLCGEYRRNVCTAGFKGIYQDDRYPSSEFLAELNPAFAGFVAEKLEWPIAQLGELAGRLTERAAALTGLPAGIAVAVGNVDAHVTSAAANAVLPGQMVAIMGTSTCHVMVGEQLAEVPGMCGVVDGGIVAGKLGYEAGQSGVGDIFGWFVDRFVDGEYLERAKAAGLNLHEYLSLLAARELPGESGLIALDWQSGNRSTLVDHELSGLIIGLTLQTRPEQVYRALVEATAFGTRKIIETFNRSGVPVREFIAAGGLLKNAFLMQIYADVLGMPIKLIRSTQGPALGSAIHAAVAAGAYSSVEVAAAAMGGVQELVYRPIAANVEAYDPLFEHYDHLYDQFGKGEVMHSLRRLRNRQIAASQSVALQSQPAPQGPSMGELAADLSDLAKTVCAWNIALRDEGLVRWTGGNVSQRTADGQAFWIKPSGISYDDLTAELMVLCDLDGNVLQGSLAPSSDTAAHAYVYKNMPEVGGIVHTHSNYASAWAAAGNPIPCALTAMADEFGGEIPIGPFAIIGNDDIGHGIVETLTGHRSPAVLMKNHGVFTIGKDAKSAVKAAVMCEDVAKTMWIAKSLAPIDRIPDEFVDRLFDRYQNVYGQNGPKEGN